MGQTKTTELSNLHEVSVKSWFSSLRESLSWEQQAGAAGSGISPRAAQTQQSCASPHLALGTPLTHSGRGCTQNLGLWPFPVTPQLQTELVAREGELTAHSAASRTLWIREGRGQDVLDPYPHFPQPFGGHRNAASNSKSPGVALG